MIDEHGDHRNHPKSEGGHCWGYCGAKDLSAVICSASITDLAKSLVETNLHRGCVIGSASFRGDAVGTVYPASQRFALNSE